MIFECPGLLRTRHTLIVLGDRVLHAIRPRWRGRVSVVDLAPNLSDMPHDGTPTALLENALSGLQLPGAVEIALGAAWARMELVTLPAKVIRRDEERKVAETLAHRMQTEQTDQTDRLLVRSARLPGHLLIAAIPERVRVGIVESLARRKIGLTTIQPLLPWLSMHRQTRFRQRDGWVVLNEPGAVSIAHLTAGEFDSLRTYRVDQENMDIGSFLLRQAAASGRPGGRAEIMTVSSAKPALPPDWSAASLFRDFPD